MFQKKIWFVLIFIFGADSPELKAQSSVLSSGKWYKIGVVERGIYQMDYDFLKVQGIAAESIDPATFQLYGNGGNGILPQANDANLPDELLENAIHVLDGGDNSFDPGDYILFFGNTSHKMEFTGERFTYEHNTYSDTVFYFLTWGQKKGKRIEAVSPVNASTTSNKVYTSIIHDINEFNLLSSGRLWFGESFDAPGKSRTLRLPVPENATRAHLEVIVMASSLSTSTFQVRLNEGSGSMELPARSGVGGTTRGFVAQESFTTPVSGGELNVQIDFHTDDSNGFGFLDQIVATVETPLIPAGEAFFFSVTSEERGLGYKIQEYEDNLELWDVTLPYEVQEIEISSEGGFSIGANQVRDLVLFQTANEIHPPSMVPLNNQNLHALSGVEFLIITHPKFKHEADRLAAYRREASGLNTEVITVDKIYNEFSSGAQDVSAIRNFIKCLASGPLRHVLLFGDASYDYKDRISGNTNFVPTYQSYNSLNEVFTYASDDYFAFLEDDEGEWPESNTGNHTMDISLGRLPVRSSDQAETIVNKIIHYEQKSDFGRWQTRVLFAADDGDDNLHHRDADDLASWMDETSAAVTVDKLYLDAYPQHNSQSSDAATRALERRVHEGTLVVDYTGHGNELQLATERLVAEFNINQWTNLNALPFFVTATCAFGVYDNPDWYSSGERLLFHPDGGGIGLISATRLVYSGSNFLVNQAFTQQLFVKQEGKYQTVGEIFRQLKNESLFGRSNRNYALLADPSMQLNYPVMEVQVDSLLNAAGEISSDLQSFSEVTLFGSVLDQGQLALGFQGSVEVVFYDQPMDKVTLGDQNEPFPYQERTSVLFSGRASVDSGRFKLRVLLPQGIARDTENAKMVLYALDTDHATDAWGGLNDINFESGGTISDHQAPEIRVFVGDTLFQSGNRVSANSDLLVYVKDESGVDLTQKDASRILRAVLNGEEIFLNQYYSTNVDTYQSGKVVYPFRRLPEGRYALTVYVSDIAGNVSEQSVEFHVVRGGELAINDFKAYPNPTADDVIFSFHHDRSNEDLMVQFSIINLSGMTVHTEEHQITDAPAVIDALDWSKTEQESVGIDAGIFLYDFVITSINDSARKRVRGRVIIK